MWAWRAKVLPPEEGSGSPWGAEGHRGGHRPGVGPRRLQLSPGKTPARRGEAAGPAGTKAADAVMEKPIGAPGRGWREPRSAATLGGWTRPGSSRVNRGFGGAGAVKVGVPQNQEPPSFHRARSRPAGHTQLGTRWPAACRRRARVHAHTWSLALTCTPTVQVGRVLLCTPFWHLHKGRGVRGYPWRSDRTPPTTGSDPT